MCDTNIITCFHRKSNKIEELNFHIIYANLFNYLVYIAYLAYTRGQYTSRSQKLCQIVVKIVNFCIYVNHSKLC